MSRHRSYIRLALLALLIAAFAAPPQVLRGQEVTEVKRKIKTQVTPSYPEVAKRMNIHGRVRLEVTVAPDGTVKSVHAVGGHPLLVSVSQEAAKGWKFESGPKETVQIIEFNFD